MSQKLPLKPINWLLKVGTYRMYFFQQNILLIKYPVPPCKCFFGRPLSHYGMPIRCGFEPVALYMYGIVLMTNHSAVSTCSSSVGTVPPVYLVCFLFSVYLPYFVKGRKENHRKVGGGDVMIHSDPEMESTETMYSETVFRIRIYMDPYIFRPLNPDPAWLN